MFTQLREATIMVQVFSEQMKHLVELQKLDARIHDLRKELDAQPALQKKAEADFEKKKAGLKAAENDLKAHQMKQKEKEMELQGKEEKVKKLQSQLYQLKSNKEYSAMELEIKGLKADNSLLEEDILKILDAVDEARKKIASEKEALAAEEKKFKSDMEAVRKRTAEINEALGGLEAKRKEQAPSIDPKLLSQYERILKGRDGLALVPVVNDSCGGCHLELPPQVVNEIQLQEKLIVCESCARILYWAP